MNYEEFRTYGKAMVDYISDYAKDIAQREVSPDPNLEPGYLRALIPEHAPENPEKFEQCMQDLENLIMPGILHWNHPNFFAYFPAGNSFPSILGDMISSAIGSIGFSWASNPVGTELEDLVLNWYGKALNIPKCFLSDEPSSLGGGVLQGSASDCTFVALMAARYRAIKRMKGPNEQEVHDSIYLPQLIAYTSKEAHSSVEKAALMAVVRIRLIDADEHSSIRTDLLRSAIINDMKAGLTPFFVTITLGTTGACAFDNVVEVSKVCKLCPSIWLHIDGAYAGNSFILPEMRKFSEGLENADSFNVNPNKLLLTNFDASALWVRDINVLKASLTVNPLYLQHEHEKNAIDYRHYGTPLSRRFRAIKLWFVFRIYGIKGIQAYIRNHIALAKLFETCVKNDTRFEVTNDVHVGLVCFRMRTDDQLNKDLLAQLNHSRKMHMVPAVVNKKYSIRFCVTYEYANRCHIVDAWQTIQAYATEILDGVHLDVNSPRASLTKRLTMEETARFSLTKEVPLEIYEAQTNHLKDLTPMFLLQNSARESVPKEGKTIT